MIYILLTRPSSISEGYFFIFSRFNAWARKEIWQELLNFCASDPDLEYVMLDATIVRAHACAAGYGEQKSKGLGQSKGGFTSKVHVKVDALGNPLKIIVTPGHRHDITQADALLHSVENSFVIADKGYYSQSLYLKLLKKNCIELFLHAQIVKTHHHYDEHLYKERHAIECFFSKIKHFRRVFSRFDKSARIISSHFLILWELVYGCAKNATEPR